jgi:hypothetical protein
METPTMPFLVCLYQSLDGKVTVARRQFVAERDAEEFAVALLGADAPDGQIVGSTVFRINPDGTFDTLNEFEF